VQTSTKASILDGGGEVRVEDPEIKTGAQPTTLKDLWTSTNSITQSNTEVVLRARDGMILRTRDRRITGIFLVINLLTV